MESIEFHSELYLDDFQVWSRFRDREFSNLRLVSKACSNSGPQGSWDVVFQQQDINNYYIFEIKDGEFYCLAKRIGELTDLVPWTPSDAILGDGVVNELTITTKGNRILASKNDEQVVELRDNSLQKGNLCLVAGTLTGLKLVSCSLSANLHRSPRLTARQDKWTINLIHRGEEYDL